jgi:hypothetical protein
MLWKYRFFSSQRRMCVTVKECGILHIQTKVRHKTGGIKWKVPLLLYEKQRHLKRFAHSDIRKPEI